MTKNIKQIQEHNRKAIIKANPQDLILKMMVETLGESPIYLNHVLLALGVNFAIAGDGTLLKYNTNKSAFDIAYFFKNKKVLKSTPKIKTYFVGTEKIRTHQACGEVSIEDMHTTQYSVKWSVKQTLEEQSEDFQEAIAELTGYNINN
jgi:hypothetical protein